MSSIRPSSNSMCSSNEEKLLAEQQENLYVVIQRSSLHNRLLPSAVIFPTRLYKQNKKNSVQSQQKPYLHISHTTYEAFC